MIINDIAILFEKLHEKYSAKEIARHFSRERKFVFMMKAGCNIKICPEFLAGLKHFGYELRLVKIENKNVTDG